MKFNTIIFLFLVFINTVVSAQTKDTFTFAPDRPGMATPPNILSFEKLQLETGFQQEHFKGDTALYDNYHIPSLLFRIGLVKNAEARISTDYISNNVTDSGVKGKIAGINAITLGTKFMILKQRKILPMASVMVNLTLPWYGSDEFKPLYLAPAVYLLVSKSICDKLNICYNIGLIRDGNESPSTGFYALSLGLSPTKKLGIFAECYGYSTKNKNPIWYGDTGLSYLINNHMQVDVSCAGQYKSDNDYYSVNVGFSWLFARKTMKF